MRKFISGDNDTNVNSAVCFFCRKTSRVIDVMGLTIADMKVVRRKLIGARSSVAKLLGVLSRSFGGVTGGEG